MKRWYLLLPVLALFLLLACSDDEPAATPTPAASPTPTTAASATPPAASPTTTSVSATAVPTVPGATPTVADPGPATQAAIDALASWLGPVADPASIEVASVTPETWPNGCLGLVRRGIACTEALVEGYRILLDLGDATYEVRTDATGDLTLWAPSTEIVVFFKEVSPNLMLFETDDGNELVVQLVPGSDIADGQLVEGQAVGLGLADAPQSGGLLLVWLDKIAQ